MTGITASKLLKVIIVASACLVLAAARSVQAGVAYGSINNFDVVNDTGVPCHGFEIELEDILSRDISYTYDWNHYGVPVITEDSSNPLHPKVLVRYVSARNTDGTWASYTAVPAGPIAPTDGHQFTDPTVNFGGEHFGVGFLGAPSVVRYFWLIDDGSGYLVRGPAVNIATPSFTYVPPAGGVPAQVQAAIVPPAPPDAPVLEFGEASWVKETITTSHNNNKVELRDLVSDDPDDPTDRNWKNGEEDEVEVEWQLLQTDFNSGGGGPNGELVGAPEELPNGDEVITRRYDFFKYVGPIDPENGEALADSVGPDGIHGEGIKIIDGVEVDLSTVEVVGEYIGAQMAGFDAAGQIGLIDHLQDGEIDVPYVDRSIVIGGTPPILATITGELPDGMTFDAPSGLLSGTPSVSDTFTFTVHATDASGGDVSNTYHLTVVDPSVVQPLHVTITTLSFPAEGGGTTGGGEYVIGAGVTVEATPMPGFAFESWTDGGTVVSTSSSYQFTADVNRELLAVFVHTYVVTTSASPVAGGTTDGDGTYTSGQAVTVVATPNPGYELIHWSEAGEIVSSSASYTFTATADRTLVANFVLAGLQRAGDANQDGNLDLSDAVWVLDHLFLGNHTQLPCDGSTASSPGAAALALVDVNGDNRIDLSDPVSILGYLFLGTEPPVQGGDCVRIMGCPEKCQ